MKCLVCTTYNAMVEVKRHESLTSMQNATRLLERLRERKGNLRGVICYLCHDEKLRKIAEYCKEAPHAD